MVTGADHAGRPGNRAWLKHVIFGVVGIVAIALVANVVTKRKAERRRVEAECVAHLNIIRAAGQPLTLADLAQAYPTPPPEHDANQLLAEVLSQVSIPTPVPRVPFFSDAEWTAREKLGEPVLGEARRLLAANQPALSALTKVDLKGARFDSGYAGSIVRVSRPPLLELSRLSKLLCLDAICHAEASEAQEAMCSAQAALLLTRTLPPNEAVNLAMRRVLEMMSCGAIEGVLNRIQPDGPALDTLETLLGDEHPDGLRDAMIAERCLGLEVIGFCRQTATQAVQRASFPLKPVVAFQLKEDVCESALLRFLDHTDRLLEALRLPYRERESAAKDLCRQWKAEQDRLSLALQVVNLDWSRIVKADAKTIASLRIARAGVAVERWRLAHNGDLPDALAQLTPAFLTSLPADPFDDQPLRYKKLPRGYVVYSLGPDFSDDGGKERPADVSDATHYDITFTVER